jgi:topoisomerase-4 subunit A
MTGRSWSRSCSPGVFPNLLANGSSGIAVGMATNIPPHNVAELCEAMELMIDAEKEVTVKDLVKIVTGPDFPTGGILVEDRKDIITAYETGEAVSAAARSGRSRS